MTAVDSGVAVSLTHVSDRGDCWISDDGEVEIKEGSVVRLRLMGLTVEAGTMVRIMRRCYSIRPYSRNGTPGGPRNHQGRLPWIAGSIDPFITALKMICLLQFAIHCVLYQLQYIAVSWASS